MFHFKNNPYSYITKIKNVNHRLFISVIHFKTSYLFNLLLFLNS